MGSPGVTMEVEFDVDVGRSSSLISASESSRLRCSVAAGADGGRMVTGIVALGWCVSS